MPLQLPTHFGKYLLLELIARGGMAEVYRAKARGEIGGFERIYAIKRSLPELNSNRDFLNSLINEAKITVTLSHSNIAQVYDLGKVDDNYFLAMEYVHGQDLHHVVHALRKKGLTFGVEHAIYVTMSMLAGLDVAHRKRDEYGQPLNIIHRDISPHNVLISYSGEVKIIDFGIARAANKLGTTRRGVIKGKLLYMAPEQARADTIDSRVDLFAVGMTLYWMITGILPFDADNQYDIYQKVVDCRVPNPRRYAPAISEELAEVMRVSLQRDPALRYQDAYEFRARLERVLMRMAPGYGQDTFRNYLEQHIGSPPIPEDPAPQKAGVPMWARDLQNSAELLSSEQTSENPQASSANPQSPQTQHSPSRSIGTTDQEFEDKPTYMQLERPTPADVNRALRSRRRQQSLILRVVGEPDAIWVDWVIPGIFGLLGAVVLALLTYLALVV